MKNIRLITSLVICLAALATIVGAVRSCRRAPASGAPAAPRTLEEYSRALIRERMSDPEYTNALARLADRQAKLARLRSETAREFSAWREGFLASNAEARAVFDRIQALAGQGMSPTNAAFAELAARLESLMAADPQGRNLLGRRDAIEEALKEHQGRAHDFIGARVLRQAQEHAAEEAAITGAAPAGAPAAAAVESRKSKVESPDAATSN